MNGNGLIKPIREVKQQKYKKPTNPDGDTFVWEVAMVAQEVYTKGLGVKEKIILVAMKV